MIQLILNLSLGLFSTAQYKPCVLPNRCMQEPAAVVVAQYTPCVLPNRCRQESLAPIFG